MTLPFIPTDEQKLTAVQNEAVLRALRQEPPPATLSELAAATSRDVSNLSKTMKRLADQGLVAIKPPGLTEPGRAMLDRLDAFDNGGAATIGQGGRDVDSLRGRAAPARFRANPNNPRKTIDLEELAGLAQTMVARAQLQPLKVCPPDADGVMTILIGERRWRAAQLNQAGGEADHAWLLDYVIEPGADAADPAIAAEYALIENGQRAGLSEIEQGRAALTLMEARGWDARRVAEEIGKGTEGGVRTVQNQIKVLREADPEDIARFERGESDADGKWTWVRLLATVQKARPEALKQDAGQASGSATQNALPRSSSEATPSGSATLNLAQELALLEMSVKLDRDPQRGYPNLRCWIDDVEDSPVWDHLLAQGLVQAHLWDEKRGEILASLTGKGLDWIDDHYPAGWSEILPRIKALGRQLAGDDGWSVLAEAGRYVTGYLNTEQRVEVTAPTRPTPAPTPPPRPSAPSAPGIPPKPTLRDLDNHERLAMVELMEALSTADIAPGDDRASVPVHQDWISKTAIALQQELRLISIQPSDKGRTARLTDAGCKWLDEEKAWFGDRAARLEEVRIAAGQAYWPADQGYVTAWLNVPAAEPAANADDQDPLIAMTTAAQDAVQAMHGRDWPTSAPALFSYAADLSAALGAAGLKGPFVLSDDPTETGVVFDEASNTPVLVVDVDAKLPDALSAGRAELITMALNTWIALANGAQASAEAAA